MDSLKTYRVIMSPRAQEMLDEYLYYILTEFQDPDTADKVSYDALLTIDQLSSAAGSLGPVRDPDLAGLGYKKINFVHHDYVMIYRIEADSDVARVVAVYHQSQDYENLFAKAIGLR